MNHCISLGTARTALLLCLLASLAVPPVCLADDAAQAAEARPKYLRLARDNDGGLVALQTAVVHFKSPDAGKPDVTVDLVGAVHVGEKGYYEALNKLFKGYDVVLYELVAPPGTKIPKGTRPGGHPVAMLQSGLKDMLDLEHQLQYIDYTPDNMVHADMSPDDFSKSMSERGESMVGMIFRMMGAGIAHQSKLESQGKSPQVDMLAALFTQDRSVAMKKLFAEQFESIEELMQALEGPDGSTIITERNKVALAKLAEQIGEGKKKIAVFYGAGHLGDMEERLIDEFHLQRSGERWLTAWQLADDVPARNGESPAK